MYAYTDEIMCNTDDPIVIDDAIESINLSLPEKGYTVDIGWEGLLGNLQAHSHGQVLPEGSTFVTTITENCIETYLAPPPSGADEEEGDINEAPPIKHDLNVLDWREQQLHKDQVLQAKSK